MKALLFFVPATLLIFLSFFNADAQQITLATTASDIQRACKVDPSGGYVSVGYNATSGRMQYLRFDANKTPASHNEYSIIGRNFRPSDIQPAPAATGLPVGFWVTGNANTSTGKNMFVQRITRDGVTLWCKESTTTLERGARAVVPYGDRVIVVGMKTDGVPMITCFSSNGTLVWGPYTYNHPTFTLNAEAAVLADGNVIITGSSQRFGEPAKAMTFAIAAATGLPVWFGNYGVSASSQNSGLSIATQVVSGERQVAVIGYSRSGTNIDIYFMRVNPTNGSLIRGRFIRETSSSIEEGRSICAANGKWAITGRRISTNVFYMELNIDGIPQIGSMRSYPLANSNSIVKESIDRDAAGNYFIAAHSGSFDYHFIWTTPSGLSPCSYSADLMMATTPISPSYNDTGVTRSAGNSWTNLAVGMVPLTIPATSHYSDFTFSSSSNKPAICPCNPGPMSICLNPSSSYPPYTYQWSTGSTQSCLNVSPSISTVYSCTIQDATGCTLSTAVQAKVLNASTIPAGATVTAVTNSKANLNLSTEACYTDYKVVYHQSTPGAMPMVVYTNSLPVILSGLNCNTWYEAYISAGLCGTYTQEVGVAFKTSACLAGEGEDRSNDSKEGEPSLTTDAPILAYPNPSSGFFHIDWEKTGNLSEFRVFSVDGKFLVSHGAAAGEVSVDLDLSAYPDGVYFLHCIFEGRTGKTLRIVKE